MEIQRVQSRTGNVLIGDCSEIAGIYGLDGSSKRCHPHMFQ